MVANSFQASLYLVMLPYDSFPWNRSLAKSSKFLISYSSNIGLYRSMPPKKAYPDEAIARGSRVIKMILTVKVTDVVTSHLTNNECYNNFCLVSEPTSYPTFFSWEVERI